MATTGAGEFENEITARIVGFLREIGLDVRRGVIDQPTFLPGMRVDGGVLWVDESNLTYPGDLLHEAGHLALKSPEERSAAGMHLGTDDGEEMGAMAWSYAAAVHLRIDPAVVFHSGGYRGGGQAFVENFTHGHYIGVPILQWRGLCLEARRTRDATAEHYPHMLRWVRQD